MLFGDPDDFFHTTASRYQNKFLIQFAQSNQQTDRTNIFKHCSQQQKPTEIHTRNYERKMCQIKRKTKQIP